MAVHAHRASLKVIKAIFEARYDDGYRYLDRCGETLVQIRKYSPSWVPGQIDPQRGVVTNFVHQLTLNMGHQSMLVATNDELDYIAMEKKLQVFAQEAEVLYKIIVETLNVPNTTRVGLRVQFMAPADALEEAHKFVRDAAVSPLWASIQEYTRTELRSASMLYVLEEQESGLRRRIELSPVARVQVGDPLITGLASDRGSGGVMVDIDSFTRPEEGHLPKAGMFIQKNFLSAHGITLPVLDWLRQHER